MKNRVKQSRYAVKSYVRYGYSDFFTDLNVEINSSCNRRCSYCPNSISERGLIKNERLLDEAIYKKLIDELSEINFRGRISPQLYGEPLLDKRLNMLLAYTKEHLPKGKIVLITNGDYLDMDTFDQLLAIGVDKFSITQHGASLPNALQDVLNRADKDPALRNRVAFHRFDDQSLLYNRGGLVTPPRINTIARCLDPGNPVAIDCEGNVVLCCHDYFSTVVFGNLGQSKLIDIWFSEKYIAIRKQLRQKRYLLPICRKCTCQD